MTLNRTAAFLGEPDTWEKARLLLDDVHGLWGGHRIEVKGNGEAVVETIGPPRGQARRVEVELDPAVVRQLLTNCIDCDFLSIEIPLPVRLLPDAVCTRVTLENAAGERHTVIGWSGTEPHEAFNKVVESVLRVVHHVENPLPP